MTAVFKLNEVRIRTITAWKQSSRRITRTSQKNRAREKDDHETQQGHRVKRDTLTRRIMVICLQIAIQNYFYRLLNANGIQADNNTHS